MRGSILLTALALAASPAFSDNHQDMEDLVYEPNTYRFGTPYQTFTDTSPAACAKICNGDAACEAWVYLPADYKRPARCDLKGIIGAVERRPGTVSGVSSQYHPIGFLSTPELDGGPEAELLGSDIPAILEKPAAPKSFTAEPAAPQLKPKLKEEETEEDLIFTIDPVVLLPTPEEEKAPAKVAEGKPITLTQLNNDPLQVLSYEMRPATE